MSKWHQAVAASRARNGYAIGVGVRPPVDNRHVVEIEEIVGPESIAYQWKCTSCVGCGTESTEGEARRMALTHVGGGVRILGGRPQFPFVIIATNPRKAG